MKAVFILSLVVLGALAATTSDDFEVVIKRLESSQDGKRFLDTIQLQLNAGDPADDLILMLQAEEDRIQEEQSADDKFIMINQNKCVEDLAVLTQEINDCKKRITELQELLEELMPIKMQKQAEKADAEEFRDMIKAKLDEMKVAKDLKDVEFKEEMQQHDYAAMIIEKAKSIIQAGMGTSFLQKDKLSAASFTQLAQHFKEAHQTHLKRKGWSSIFKVLAQVSASAPVQADSKGVQKIIDLCDQILDKISQSRQVELNDFKRWMKEYTSVATKLNTLLEMKEAQIDRLTNEIAVLTQRINLAKEELEDTKKRLAQKTQAYEDLENECDAEAKRYAHAREERSDKLSIVSDAIGLLTTKIRMLKKFVGERVNSLERPM